VLGVTEHRAVVDRESVGGHHPCLPVEGQPPSPRRGGTCCTRQAATRPSDLRSGRGRRYSTWETTRRHVSYGTG
jgi:hypothetical protein